MFCFEGLALALAFLRRIGILAGPASQRAGVSTEKGDVEHMARSSTPGTPATSPQDSQGNVKRDIAATG